MRPLLLTMMFATGATAFPVPKPAQNPPLAGTTWEGTIKWSTGTTKSSFKIAFRDDGRLEYGSPTIGGKATLHTWEQDGSTVKFTINNYAYYTGILSGNTLDGTSKNKANNTGEFTLTRKETP